MENIFLNKVKKVSLITIGIGLILTMTSFFMVEEGNYNYPWASIYTSSMFFMFISLGAMFFLTIQYVTQAGWSIILLRIIEGIASFIPIGGAIIIILLLVSSLHINYIFHWMDSSILDKTSEHYDEIIANKTAYLNIPFFLIRSLIYIIGWSLLYFAIRKNSTKIEASNNKETSSKLFFRGRRISAIFLVFFAVTSSMASWDWIMSIDTHWFSTLFGWYTLSGMIVTGIIVTMLIAIVLNKAGLFSQLKKSHIHDLAKFIFGFSMFWAYLWVSQFILIWYSNIPEEVTYYMARFENYKIPLMISIGLNFFLPFFSIMSSDSKGNYRWVYIIGCTILLGQFLNLFMMIIPGSYGENWSLGLAEIGSLLLIEGIFIYVVFKSILKKNIILKNHPMLEESEHFSYYNVEE